MAQAKPKPWERQPGESPQAFHAFALYRDMQGRTLRKVCMELAAQLSGLDNPNGDNGLPQTLTIIQEGDRRATSPLQKSAWGRVSVWSSQYRWVERVAEWDRQVDQYVQARRLDDITKMRKLQAQEARLTARTLMLPMMRLWKEANTPEGEQALSKISIYDWLGLAMESAVRIPKVHEGERRANAVVLEDETPGAGHFVAKIDKVVPDRPPDRELTGDQETERANGPWNGEDLPEDD